MSYKEVVDILIGLCETHKFVNTFSYGEISDVMTPEDKASPDYPYVFLNPTQVSSTFRTSTFSFNLICMEQAHDNYDSIIQAQSDCIEILFDIISKIEMGTTYPTLSVNSDFVFTPFVERMKDNVVGASVVLSLTFQNAINGCNLPY